MRLRDLFAATLFLGSLLMFVLEPLVARQLLPQLGGAPSVWNACVLFFQLVLLAGYATAHAGSRVGSARAQALGCVCLVGTTWLLLPWFLRAGGAPSPRWPTLWLLGELSQSIGAQFFALSIAAPTLQRWFSRSRDQAARDPYVLYAASNAGSLAGLLAYPLLIEPSLALTTQRRVWVVGFLAFGALLVVCARAAYRTRSPLDREGSSSAVSDSGRVSWASRAHWILLSAVPASLMLGVTQYLTTDIAAVPLLWVVPLALYLGSFIIAFTPSSSRWSHLSAARLPLLVTALTVMLAARVGGPLWLVLPLHLLTFAAAATACHGRLAAGRPHPTHLTDFYLCVALGGAAGSAFNTFVAPRIFTGVAEYPLAIIAAALIAPPGARLIRASLWQGLGVGAATAALFWLIQRAGALDALLLPALSIPALLAFRLSRQPLSFATAIGSLLVAAALSWQPYGEIVETRRTFFGVYRVTENHQASLRSLYHGTTLHGMQTMSGSGPAAPLTYYHREGPFGQAHRTLPSLHRARRVAVIGLGVGSLAAYAVDGQRWTFYEIDPAVEEIARDPAFFRHLADCGDWCDVVVGDARLSLARSPHARYDVLVLDAFSSDAIPIHLITREALALYLERLNSDGVLAVHISNRLLDLAPVLAAVAEDAGLAAAEQAHTVTADQSALGHSSSRWVVMSRNTAEIDRLLGDSRWTRLQTTGTSLWTDDYSNLFDVLSF